MVQIPLWTIVTRSLYRANDVELVQIPMDDCNFPDTLIVQENPKFRFLYGRL